MTLATQIVTDITSIEPWKDAWEDLYSAGAHEPSVSYEWTAALLRNHVRAQDRAHLLILNNASQPAGFIPLIARNERVLGQTLTTLAPLSERYNTHSGFLFNGSAEDLTGALMDCLANPAVRWDVFRMNRLLEQDAVLEQFEQRLARGNHPHRIQFEPPSFFMPLPDSMDRYLAQRSGKFRNYLRRTEKKLGALGSVAFEVVDNRSDIEQAYRKLLHVEGNSWKHRHGTAISAVDHQTAFYRDMCVGAAARDRLHLSLFYLNDEPIAYNMGYFSSGCYYYLKTSYDERLRSAGVATVARSRLIEVLIRHGTRFFDFPGEPYEWEQQWTDELRWHKSIALYNRNLRGVAFYALSRLRQALSKRPPDRSFEFCDARALQPPKD